MAIETTCQGCQKLLRVADQHAGKPARCPSCGTIYTVPGAAMALNPAPPPFTPALPQSKPAERWLLQTADGLTFGPVPRGELDRWLAEGRITPQSLLQREGSFSWEPAGQVYPQLRMPMARNSVGGSPVAGQAGNPFADTLATTNPYAPPGGGTYTWPGGPSARWREPHRGGAILTLAIFSIFFCDLLTIAALIMAIIDLNKMSSGTMDPSGRGLTIAGLVIAALKLLFLAGIILLAIAGEL